MITPETYKLLSILPLHKIVESLKRIRAFPKASEAQLMRQAAKVRRRAARAARARWN